MSQAILNMSTADNFTWTGTTGNEGFQTAMTTGKTASFYFGNTSGGTASNAPNLTFTGTGTTGIPTITTASWFKKLDITGSTGVIPATTLNLRSLTLGSTASAYVNLSAAMKATGTLTLVGTPNVNLAMATLTIGTTATTTTLASAFYCTTCTFTSLSPDFTNVLALSTFAFTCTGTMTYAGGSITAGSAAGTITCTTFTLNNPGGLSLPFGGFAGANLTCTTGFTHTSGNLAVTATTNLGYQSASINTCVYTYNVGNITLSSSVVLTVGQFTVGASTTGTRVIAFGAGGTIDLAHSTAATAVLNIGGSVTGLSYTGTGAYGFTSSMNFNGSAITRTFTSTSALTAVNFPLAITGGSGVITFTTSSYFSILSFGTWSGTIAASATTYITASATLNGTGNFTNLTLSTTSNTPGNVTITGSTSTTLTGVTHNNVGYTLTLGSNLTLIGTGTFNLTAGTLILNTYTLSCGVFAGGSSTCAITFGATNIVLTNDAAGGTVLSMATPTGFSWTGTGGFTSAMGIAKTFAFGSTSGGTVSNAPNLTFTGSGTAIPTISTGSWFNLLNFGTITAIMGVTSVNLNSLTLSATSTFTSLTVTMRSTGTIISNGNTTLVNLTINSNGITSLGGIFTLAATGVTTLTLGTLNLAGYQLTTGTFSSSNSSVRTISWGTGGSISLVTTAFNATNLVMSDITNFSYTGTGSFTAVMNVKRTFTCGSSLGATTANAPSLTLSSGTAVPTFTSGSWFNLLDMSGVYVIIAATTLNLNGLSLGGGTGYTNLTLNLVGTGTITGTGVAYVGTVTKAAAGTTTVSALSTGAFLCSIFNMSAGTLDVNGQSFTVSGTFTYTGGTLTNTGTGAISSSTFILNYSTGLSLPLSTNSTFICTTAFTHTLGTVTTTADVFLGACLYTHTVGTITVNGFTLSIGAYAASSTGVRTIAFGTGGRILLETASSVIPIINIPTGTTNITYTGTGGFSTAASIPVIVTSLVIAVAPALYITAGSGKITFSMTVTTIECYFNKLDFTGTWAGTMDLGGGRAFLVSTTPSLTLNATGDFSALWVTSQSATGNVTIYGGNSSANPLGSLQQYNATYSTTLGSNIAIITLGLYVGALNLNNYTITSSYLDATGGDVRSIAFGTGNIELNGAGEVMIMEYANNFTWTGTGGFIARMDTAKSFGFGYSAGGTTANAPNLRLLNSGTAAVPTFISGSWFNNLDFTGCASIPATTNLNLNSLTLDSTGTYTTLTATMRGTGTITGNGKTLASLVINTTGTTTLATALTATAAILTAGILNLAGQTLSLTTTFTGTGTTARSITGTMGASGTRAGNAGTIQVGTNWVVATSTNLTGSYYIINMVNTSTKTFTGGGGSYGTLNQGGSGALTVVDSSTFENITASYYPSTITITAGTTQTLAALTLAGIVGNLITLNSSTGGTQFTLTKPTGIVSSLYLSIQDSNATGGAGWYASTTSTDVSNNTGWNFTATAPSLIIQQSMAFF